MPATMTGNTTIVLRKRAVDLLGAGGDEIHPGYGQHDQHRADNRQRQCDRFEIPDDRFAHECRNDLGIVHGIVKQSLNAAKG